MGPGAMVHLNQTTDHQVVQSKRTRHDANQEGAWK